MNNNARYVEDVKHIGENDVVFIARDSGRKLVRCFNSPYMARQFVNKLKRSKKCVLVSYPTGINW